MRWRSSISDQRMPGMQGTEVLAQSREIYPLARRVMLTAYSDIDAAIKAINDAHLDHYLAKPWDPPEECLFPGDRRSARRLAGGVPARSQGARLVGHQWSPRSHAIKDFLAGNLIPYRWLDVARDPDTAGPARRRRHRRRRAPGALLRGWLGAAQSRAASGRRAARPTRCPRPRRSTIWSSSAPARRVWRPRCTAPRRGCGRCCSIAMRPAGRRAAARRIENYLGFPDRRQRQRADAARREQAQRLGAELLVPLEVTGVSIDGGYKRLTLSDGRADRHATLLAATGMEYREHPAAGVLSPCRRWRVLRRRDDRGAGVQGPARPRRRRRQLGGAGGDVSGALRDRGADRGPPRRRLRDTMSHYLIEQIEKTPNIRVRARTELERVEGTGRSNGSCCALDDGTTEVEDMDAVFVFIGTRPRSEWLPADVLRDDKGFVITGRDLTTDASVSRAPGRSGVSRWRSRPACPVCSPPATFAPAR